jgi:hypothetical protein
VRCLLQSSPAAVAGGGGGGDASAANQSTQIALETAINNKLPALVGGKIPVDASVSITGGATEAKQDTGNSSLSSINGKITDCTLAL